MFSVVNVISFSALDQQLLRFSPSLDHVTEMMCHLFKSVQFDFKERNFTSGFGIKLLRSLLLLHKYHHVFLILINLDHYMFCKMLCVLQ